MEVDPEDVPAEVTKFATSSLEMRLDFHVPF